MLQPRAAAAGGAPVTFEPWPVRLADVWPSRHYSGQTETVVVIYRREPYRRARSYEDSLHVEIKKFIQEGESLLARRRRVSRAQRRLAESRLRRFGLPALPEAMFKKPTFVRRACGSRWRVMTP